MIVLGSISAILAGLAFGLALINFIQEENPIVGSICLIVCIVLTWSSVSSFDSYEKKISSKSIKCKEIQQIDTLYKNDSIIGYEIYVIK